MTTTPPFEQLVATHGATVLRVCRAVVGPDDAEDAWSETFLAALRAYPAVTPGTNLEAWLVTIAHRKAIDLWRARRRRPLPVAHLPEPAGPAAEQPDREVWSVVATLPDKQRQAIAYHYLAGLPFAEVAAILGGSTDAARRAAADGMTTLRHRYGAPTPGDRR